MLMIRLDHHNPIPIWTECIHHHHHLHRHHHHHHRHHHQNIIIMMVRLERATKQSSQYLPPAAHLNGCLTAHMGGLYLRSLISPTSSTSWSSPSSLLPFYKWLHSAHYLKSSLLAPQSGALTIGAYRDFQPIPIPIPNPLIAFEHLSLSIVITNNASRPRQINVD